MTEREEMWTNRLADDLERLCCAETEAKFFDLVTDSIGDIIAALRSAARTGPDVAWFEACRGTLKQTSVSTVATTIYCRGIGEIPSIVLDDESIDRIIAALPAPAGESVTVEVDISDVQFPLSKTALDAFQSGFKNQLRERHKNRFSDKPMISAEEAGLRAMLATITRQSGAPVMSDLREALKRSIAELEYCLDHAYSPDVTTIKRLKSIAALAQPEAVEPVPLVWRDGAPPKPWADEWFIARTTFNDRVVLTALPEEYSYDFKTADDTYIKADRIKQWMQFPDSQFIAPPLAPDERMRRALETIVFHCTISTDGNEIPTGTIQEVALKALSRADEGKESEGGIIGPININPKILSRVSVSSDPTPPDATAQREAIARALERHDMRNYKWTEDQFETWWTKDKRSKPSRKLQRSRANAILAIQTRAGG